MSLTQLTQQKNGFYVIQFISEAHTLHNNTQIYGQVISSGELVINAKYLAWSKDILPCQLIYQHK